MVSALIEALAALVQEVLQSLFIRDKRAGKKTGTAQSSDKTGKKKRDV